MARLYLGALLFVVAVFEITAQSCNIINGNSYDTAGDMLNLYNIPSYSACCTSCQAFAESQHWTYGNLTKICVCKTQNSGTLSSSSSSMSGDIIRAAYAQSGVTCGSISASTDFTNSAVNVKAVSAVNASACCTPCTATAGCNAWTYYQGVCYLKSTPTGVSTGNSATTSGTLSSPVAPLRTGKRGLGWFNSNTCTDLLSLNNLAWLYNWSDNPPANLIQCMLANGIEWIPMIWGKTLPVVTSTIYVAPNTKHLLTFNEPNFASQSNMTPAAAAAQWPAIEQFAKSKNLSISSPAAAAGGNPDPITWLDQFFGNCTNCTVDFITTHIYTCSAPGTTGWLAAFKKYNKPIWLTEFDCPKSGLVNATNYVTSLLPLLDADPAYERYAYFGLRVEPGNTDVGTENSIFNSSSNALTAIGVAYNTPPASSTTAAPTSSPTTAVPTTVPTTVAPTTVAATTVKATTVAPTTLAPTTIAPTTVAPTTVAATTVKSTTVAPTTLAPTTVAPTTVAPTTVAATTVKSTTVAPTTLAPTTVAATTMKATTVAPTTVAATTIAPTTITPTTVVTTTAKPTSPTTTSAPASPFPGKVVIRSVSTSKYVVANTATGSYLNATATTATADSVFTVSSVSGGGWTMFSSTLSNYVCADNWGGSPLIANRGSASTWETFNFTKQASGYYTITAWSDSNFVEILGSTGLLADVAVTTTPPNSCLFAITTSS